MEYHPRRHPANGYSQTSAKIFIENRGVACGDVGKTGEPSEGIQYGGDGAAGDGHAPDNGVASVHHIEDVPGAKENLIGAVKLGARTEVALKAFPRLNYIKNRRRGGRNESEKHFFYTCRSQSPLRS